MSALNSVQFRDVPAAKLQVGHMIDGVRRVTHVFQNGDFMHVRTTGGGPSTMMQVTKNRAFKVPA